MENLEHLDNLRIGKAIINYNEDGSVIGAHFESKMDLSIDSSVYNSLTPANNTEQAKTNADLVFAGYINNIDNVELADRNLYKIESNIVESDCEKWENGNIKSCSIEYTFKKV
jgi:hypothetical protein